MYMYIFNTTQGYRIKTYMNTFGENVHYIGYTKKQAIKKHRDQYGLKYKRLQIIEM